MKASRVQTLILSFIPIYVLACDAYGQKPPPAAHKITVTTVQSRDVTVKEPYTCRLSSQRSIDVRAPEDGYLQEISLREGQAVKQGEVMFRFLSILHRARLDAEMAEAQIAQLEFNNTKRMFEKRSISETEVQLSSAKLAKARARVDLARAELNFTEVKAPFDGIIDRIRRHQGSFVLKGETLTSLYDNSIMRAYFNVPEAAYIKYMAGQREGKDDPQFELVLAGGQKFDQAGRISAIEAAFDEKTGTILFRVDFPNPNRLLRHGQTGTLLSSRVLKGAIVIPQQATFEQHGERRVFAVDKENVAHFRAIAVQAETDNLFVVKNGVAVGEKIVLDGTTLVRDGQTVEYEVRDPEK